MSNSTEKNVFETKVSLPTVATSIIIVVCGLIAGVIWITVIASHSTQRQDDVLTRHWGTIGIVAGYLFLISPFVINYLKLSKVKWTITDKRLIIKRGSLFQNAYYHMTPDQIFEATYNQDFVSKLFNFGTVNVRKNIGGFNSYETQIRIKNPVECVRAINQLVNDYKAGIKISNQSSYVSESDSSSIDELEKLIKLRETGKISEEDFQLFKSKLLSK